MSEKTVPKAGCRVKLLLKHNLPTIEGTLMFWNDDIAIKQNDGNIFYIQDTSDVFGCFILLKKNKVKKPKDSDLDDNEFVVDPYENTEEYEGDDSVDEEENNGIPGSALYNKGIPSVFLKKKKNLEPDVAPEIAKSPEFQKILRNRAKKEDKQ